MSCPTVEKARLYYDSCLDHPGNIESLEGRPLLDLIRKHIGTWSLLEPPAALTASADSDAVKKTQQQDDLANFNETSFQMRLEIFHNTVSPFLNSFHSWLATFSVCNVRMSKQYRVNFSLKLYSGGGLFTWSVGENDKNSSQHVIHVDQVWPLTQFLLV